MEKRENGRKDDMDEYRRWEDNIKTFSQDIGVDVMNWIELAQNGGDWRALFNLAFNLRLEQVEKRRKIQVQTYQKWSVHIYKGK